MQEQSSKIRVAIIVGVVLTLVDFEVLQAVVTSPEEGVSADPRCPISPAGVPGIPGIPGPYGPVGPKGDMGSPGDVGMHGAKGDKGSYGLKGERGATGEPGQKGEQGIGQPGKEGPHGLPGIAGLMGERGVPGPVGLKGQQGECVERTQRVAFTVVRNAGFTQSNTNLPFEEILFEEGTHFDLPTGTFTCNLNGIYVFMFSFLKVRSVGIANARMFKNGDVIVSGYAEGSGNYLQGSNSAVMSLQEGDQVYLEAGGSLHSNSNHYTSFSGFLLYGNN